MNCEKETTEVKKVPHTPISKDVYHSICEEIRHSAKSLDAMCTDRQISIASFYKYREIIGDESEKEYARARQDQGDFLADQLIEIADKSKDARLGAIQIDARKWSASKLRPKRYGDHQTIEITQETTAVFKTITDIMIKHIPKEKQSEVLTEIQIAMDFGSK